MENTSKQNIEETPKKAWITPEMEEININTGLNGGIFEFTGQASGLSG